MNVFKESGIADTAYFGLKLCKLFFKRILKEFQFKTTRLGLVKNCAQEFFPYVIVSRRDVYKITNSPLKIYYSKYFHQI